MTPQELVDLYRYTAYRVRDLRATRLDHLGRPKTDRAREALENHIRVMLAMLDALRADGHPRIAELLEKQRALLDDATTSDRVAAAARRRSARVLDRQVRDLLAGDSS